MALKVSVIEKLICIGPDAEVVITCIVFPNHVLPSVSIIPKNGFKLESCLVRWSCIPAFSQGGHEFMSLVMLGDFWWIMIVGVLSPRFCSCRNVEVQSSCR